MAKFPRGGFFCPWFARTFIGTHQHATPFLTHINLTIKINGVNDLRSGGGIHFCHLGHVVGEKVHMLHRQHGQLKTHHAANFTRPEPRSIDHMFGCNRSLVGQYLPCAVRVLRQIFYLCVGVELGTIFACSYSIGMCNTVRVYMALCGVIHGTYKLRWVD